MKIIKIGRSSSNHIVINDQLVTRNSHCQIILDDYGNFRLIDNSTNGTFVNGTRIGKGAEIPLNHSDIIRIGNETLPWQTYFGETEIGGSTIVGVNIGDPPKPQKSGGFGIAAFILGILGGSLLAIVFGAIGWQRNRRNRGLAIAGFVLGCVWLLFWIIYYSILINYYSPYYY